MNNYETVIGLEVHLHIATKTKAFCACKNEFGLQPNSSTCPVCLGFPGSLPVLNEKYLTQAIKVALALNCKVAKRMKFDRKNYFYPDLPKNYQISQYDMPLAQKGVVNILKTDGATKTIRIKRVHMEEDAGKLMHQSGSTNGNNSSSLVDYNRSGVPLLEIVTEPDMDSPDEAYAYLVALKSLLKYLDVSDCDMEKGSLRCDANISIRPKGETELGTKVELKNMNSFKAVKAALEHEVQRQTEAKEAGEKIIQETRLWDADKKKTYAMRTKEYAHDYRYFPDPDLVPFNIDDVMLDNAAKEVTELPDDKKKRFIKEYSISDYDAYLLISDKALANFFEECVKLYKNTKAIVNWLGTEVLKYLNAKAKQFSDISLTPGQLTDMLKMIDEGLISGKMAKDIIIEMIETKKSAHDIVKEKGLTQISDESKIKAIVADVLKNNSGVAADYKKGKTNALAFLVGQVMKATKGKANPGIVNKLLKEELEK